MVIAGHEIPLLLTACFSIALLGGAVIPRAGRIVFVRPGTMMKNRSHHLPFVASRQGASSSQIRWASRNRSNATPGPLLEFQIDAWGFFARFT